MAMHARKRMLSLVFLIGVLVGAAAKAAEAPPATLNPALEKQVMTIAEELRCLVCQNQTIADSHAELATDLKNQVREMLQQGKTEQEIKRYMVERYGDFVLYRPPVRSHTWLLWLGPFFLLAGALTFAAIKLRQRGKEMVAAGDVLDEQARMRAEQLLGINAVDRANDSINGQGPGKEKA